MDFSAELAAIKLIDEPTAAERLGLKAITLQDWRRRGIGPPFLRLGPKTIRYRVKDLAEWQSARTEGTTAQVRKGG
jgi:predicted DNA-binding transcriptional regulator AlpA